MSNMELLKEWLERGELPAVLKARQAELTSATEPELDTTMSDFEIRKNINAQLDPPKSCAKHLASQRRYMMRNLEKERTRKREYMRKRRAKGYKAETPCYSPEHKAIHAATQLKRYHRLTALWATVPDDKKQELEEFYFSKRDKYELSETDRELLSAGIAVRRWSIKKRKIRMACK